MRNFFKSRVGAVLGGLIFFVALAAGVVTVFELHYVGRFYPGVVFAGVKVGGMDFLSAQDRLASVVDELESEGIVIVLKVKEASYLINVPMSVSGLSSDTVVNYFDVGGWQKELIRAYEVGRGGSLLKRAREQAGALLLGQEVGMPFSFYKDSVEAFLSREVEGILAREEPAGYVFKEGYNLGRSKTGEFL